MKKKNFVLGFILVCLILFLVYFVFGQPLNVMPISVTHGFNNPSATGLNSNFTWAGRNATINFTMVMADWGALDGNITEISFDLPDNVIFSDIGNASNGTALNTTLGDDWWCEGSPAGLDYYLNWSCYNATESQLGSNDKINIWFNITANSTATGPITFSITVVGNSTDQEANTTEFSIMAAQPTFLIENDINQFNVTPGSNSVHTLRANISNVFGAEINNTILTWYLPYGMVNNSVCNGTNGYWQVNSTVHACDQNIGNFTPSYSTWANDTVTLEVNDTIEAFSDYYALSGVAIPETFWVTVNCTGTDNSFDCEQNETTLSASYGINYWKNPRPYAVNDSSTTDMFLRFENWAQARERYEVWVPLMTYNDSAQRIEPSVNGSWADIVYADKSFMEGPNYLELWGYRLNFTFYNDSAASSNITFHIYTPEYEFENQTLQPLLIRNETTTGRDGVETSQILAAPAQEGFSVWYNGTELTRTTLRDSFGINLTFNTEHGKGDNKMLTVVSVPEYENVSLSVLFTLTNNASIPVSRSPIHVLMQDVGGFNPMEAPPVLNGSVDMKFRIDVENALQNFTLDGLSVHLLNPINMTNEATGDSFNMSEGATVTWLYPGNDTWMAADNIVEKSIVFGMDDNVSGSPSFGQNISIYFKTYDIDLNHSYFNNWDPGSSASNISVNLTATVKFPIANFTDTTPDSAGSFNEYNMSMSVGQRGRLNLTDILSGVGTDVNSTISVYIDGELQTNGGNYTVGSLELNDVGQGSHSVTVSYTKASSAAAATGGGTSSTTTGTSSAVDASEGIVRTMSVKDALVISLGVAGGGSAGGSASHQIVVDKLTSDSVTLLVYSEPVEVVLKVGESKKVDVDGDGILDVLIKLRSIDVPHKKADIYFEDITPKREEAPPGEVVVEGEEEEVEEPEVPTGKVPAVPEVVPSGKVWVWMLVIGLLVALVAAYFIAKKKGYDIISFGEESVEKKEQEPRIKKKSA